MPGQRKESPSVPSTTSIKPHSPTLSYREGYLLERNKVEKLTREQILDLKMSFSVWQQDYDPVHDKEQHDMFALGVAAMDEILAAMNGESVVVTDRMALDFHSAITDGPVGTDDVEEIKTGLRASLANISVPVTDHERREWMAQGIESWLNSRNGRWNGTTNEAQEYSAMIRAGEVDL